MGSVGTIRTDFDVDLVQAMGDDEMICRAARVSTLGADSLETSESVGLINFLMKNRHGTPFEHGSMTFRISAPIFVWREFHRHRIGFSYNEESGRYKQLDPVFYVPGPERPLIQVGKAGEYTYEPGTPEDTVMVVQTLAEVYNHAYRNYESLLHSGVAREVSRMCLPVAIYSTCYVTCNPRSLMAFLSLRTKYDTSTFKSFPQWEIEQVAHAMASLFEVCFPITYRAFRNHGSVSP